MMSAFACFAIGAINALLAMVWTTAAPWTFPVAVFAFGAGIANAVYAAGEKQ